MFKPANQVVTTGTVVMINTIGNLTIVQLATDGGGSHKAYPRFAFRKDDSVRNFKVGERVDITGHIQNRIIRNAEREKIGYEQEIEGDIILHTPRMLCRVFPNENIPQMDGGYALDRNEAVVVGTVSHVYAPDSGVVILTVEVPDDSGRINHCEVTCFLRQAETARMLMQGDEIAAVGVIQTSSKVKDGRRITYQCFTARDIAKVSIES